MSINSLEALRELIQTNNGWGSEYQSFREAISLHTEGNTRTTLDYRWGMGTGTLQQQFELLQYLHKYCEPSR